MAYNIKENREEKNSERKRERVNQAHTIFLFSKTRFDNKEKNENERKAQPKHMFVSK
jgi:hypothetical protein